jgi:hypothetical protein
MDGMRQKTLKNLVLALLGMFIGAGFAQGQKAFGISADLESSYVQGASGSVSIAVQLTDASLNLSQAVVFLNIVENNPAKNYPQAGHLIFAAAAEEPQIFRLVWNRDALLNGLATSLSFSLKDNARPGDYSLVIQVFRGTNTNPNGVRVEDRIALKSFAFRVE